MTNSIIQTRSAHYLLSSKQEEQDQNYRVTLGADDFIGKPFSKHLLTLRVKSVLRRHEVKAIDPERQIEVGALSIDVSRHLVTWYEKAFN